MQGNKIENASRDKDTILITEVTAYHFDLILFIRSKSLGPAYSRRGITQGCEYQETAIMGPHLRNCLLHD